MSTTWSRRVFVALLAAASGYLASDSSHAQDLRPLPRVERVAVEEQGAIAQVSAESSDVEARMRDLEERLERQQAAYEELRREFNGTPRSMNASLERSSATNIDLNEAPKPYTVGSDNKMSGVWKNGLEFQSANKDFRVHIGGRTQIDSIWFNGSPAFANTGASSVGDADAVDFRRARIRIDGDMYETMDWCAEYDFVNTVNDDPTLPATERTGTVINVPVPTDLWWTFKELPWVGNFRIGNQKEPIGLEHLTSSRYLDFMERSFNQDLYTGPFNNGFTPGIAISDTFLNDRASYSLGGFKNGNNAFAYDTGDGEYAATGRLTLAPYFDEPSNGRYLVHLGLSGSYRDLDEGRLRYRSRGSLRNGPGALNPNMVDTGFFNGDSQRLMGAEAAIVWGPLLLQGEYMGSWVNNASTTGGANLGNVFTHGYYVEALWFLTGEHREYEQRFGGAAFGRVVPHENAFLVRDDAGCWCFGRGAWQVGARYQKADLDNGGVNGGIIDDVTIGLNWFLNPNAKVQWNYIHAWRDAPGTTGIGDGQIDGFGMRFAQDF